MDANEGCALADVDRNGRMDVIPGHHWYAAPVFTPRPLRMIDDGDGYVRSNGDHAYPGFLIGLLGRARSSSTIVAGAAHLRR